MTTEASSFTAHARRLFSFPSGGTKKRALQFLGPVITLVVLTVAFVVLHRTLRHYHYRDVIAHLQQLPLYKLLLAMALTACSYFLLTLYDTLGVRAIKHPLRYRRIALVSFIGYAFNNNFGFAGLAGNSLRYRIYTSWGLTPFEVAKVISFCIGAFWMGFLSVAGLSFLIDPVQGPTGLGLNTRSMRLLGFLFLIPVLVYLSWSLFRKDPIRVGRWKLALPGPRISFAQITLAGLDWTVAASVFYFMLPTSGHISFPQLMGVFLLAQMAGLASHVPGGIGVFEAVVLVSLTPPHSLLPQPFSDPQVFAAALAYRGIYYLFPLVVAVVLLGFHELRRQSSLFSHFGRLVRFWPGWQKIAAPARTIRRVGEWAPGLVPNVFAFAVFLAGAILLFSSATPGLADRLTFLHSLLPRSIISTAHLLTSMLGLALLLVAYGLYRRLDSAFVLSLVLLAAGIPLSLLKGFDYEEALILTVILLAFIPCRSHFYRKAALLSRFSIAPAWALAIGVTLAISIWLGFFSYNHLQHKPALLSPSVLLHEHYRFIRGSICAVGLLSLYALKVLFKPAPPEFLELREHDWNAVRAIVAGSPRTYAWLAMLGDKRFLLNDARSTFIMYAVEGRSWIAMGDPVGLQQEKAELAWKFRELSDSHGGWATFYQVSPENLPLYLDLGLMLVKIGEEGVVSLENFNIQGQSHKSLRHSYHRVAREGYQFKVVPPQAAIDLLPQLKLVSDAWLDAKKMPEKKFSLGSFTDSYVQQFPIALVRDPHGGIAAFANLWATASHQELSIDMMRYRPGVHPGLMDYLFVELMLWAKAEGWSRFNLGVAPLAGLEGRSLAPLWSRVGSLVFTHGEHFHHLRGLRQYKQKFHPVWTPTYLASPGGIALPVVVANLTSLISHRVW